MAEYVILVDGDDNPVGTEEKVRCHMPGGRLHRAFTALLFDGGGRLILGRRAAGKMLWPGYWDGTFASHPREGETYAASGRRRMPEELGVRGMLDYMHKFEYHVPYGDVGSENEMCATLVGTADPASLRPADGEIDGVRTVTAGGLLGELAADPGPFCPWMLIALALLGRSEEGALGRHSAALSAWTGAGAREGFLAAADAHLPRDMWRLVDGR